MATVKLGKVSHSWLMSNKNPKSSRPQVASIYHFVPAAAVTAYNAAADDAARALTLIGALLVAENALTIGVEYKVDVGFVYTQDAAIPPTAQEFVYAVNKIGVSYTADGEYYTSSIPARDEADIVMSNDGVTVDTGAGASAETTAYIAAFNAVVLSEEAVAATIANMYVRD